MEYSAKNSIFNSTYGYFRMADDSINLTVRNAVVSDLPVLTEILNQGISWGSATAFLEPLHPYERSAWFEKHQAPPYLLLVAETEDQVVGYATIGPYREGREAFLHVAEISYFIDFNHHRKGIASALFREAFRHCKENGIETLLAFLYATNDPSIRLLEKFGFERWGLFPGLIRRPEQDIDHVIYGRNLEY